MRGTRLSSRDSLTLSGESAGQGRRLFQAGQAERARVIEADLAVLQAADAWWRTVVAGRLARVDVLRAFSGPVEPTSAAGAAHPDLAVK